MRTYQVILILFAVFLFEGTFFYWFTPDFLQYRTVPRIMLIFVVFAGLYRDRLSAMFFGMGFGFLQDLVYYDKIFGIHSFLLAGIGYLFGRILERRNVDRLVAAVAVGLATMLFELTQFLLYRVFQLTDMTLPHALGQWILFTIFLQIVLSMALQLPLRRIMERDEPNIYEP